LRRQGQHVDRNTPRRPFFVQCFFAAPFAIFNSVATVLMRVHDPASEATRNVRESVSQFYAA
jgi:hypothetical protein